MSVILQNCPRVQQVQQPTAAPRWLQKKMQETWPLRSAGLGYHCVTKVCLCDFYWDNGHATTANYTTLEEAVKEIRDSPLELKARAIGQPSLLQLLCGSEWYLGLYLTVWIKYVMNKFSFFILDK